MRALITSCCFSAVLSLSPAAYAAGPATPPSDQAQAEALIAEVLKNVNWELLLKLQQTLLSNLDLVMPYTEEYIGCLKAEGVIDDQTPLNLERIITQSQTAAKRCNAILESLAGKLNFSLSEREIEEGLSPEYRELLEKSL